jgi:hypothetical protein
LIDTEAAVVVELLLLLCVDDARVLVLLLTV